MKRSNRTVQHKETVKSETKTAQELRTENQRLRKKVARLQRELEKREPIIVVEEPDVELTPDEPVEVVVPVSENGCPECGTELTLVHLGAKLLRACRSCKYRKMDQNGTDQ